jgi:hypothetical protein
MAMFEEGFSIRERGTWQLETGFFSASRDLGLLAWGSYVCGERD